MRAWEACAEVARSQECLRIVFFCPKCMFTSLKTGPNVHFFGYFKQHRSIETPFEMHFFVRRLQIMTCDFVHMEGKFFSQEWHLDFRYFLLASRQHNNRAQTNNRFIFKLGSTQRKICFCFFFFTLFTYSLPPIHLKYPDSLLEVRSDG